MLELIEKGARGEKVDDTLTLPYDLRQRSRQRVRLDSGKEAAVFLPPGTALEDGDRLLAADGSSVLVSAAKEAVSTAYTGDPLRLARACYHLGNRHVPLQIGAGWVRYQPDHVLDELVLGLGLSVTRDVVGFEPEGGAYRSSAARPHGHDHGHGSNGHSHSHPH